MKELRINPLAYFLALLLLIAFTLGSCSPRKETLRSHIAPVSGNKWKETPKTSKVIKHNSKQFNKKQYTKR